MIIIKQQILLKLDENKSAIFFYKNKCEKDFEGFLH